MLPKNIKLAADSKLSHNKKNIKNNVSQIQFVQDEPYIEAVSEDEESSDEP